MSLQDLEQGVLTWAFYAPCRITEPVTGTYSEDTYPHLTSGLTQPRFRASSFSAECGPDSCRTQLRPTNVVTQCPDEQ